MFKEIGLGGGAALLAFLAWKGVNIMPVFLVAGLLLLLYFVVERRGEVTVAKIGACLPRSTITFDDVGGQGPAKQELREAMDFILQAESIRDMGIRPLKGILLEGPPGTGKTMLAKAAAAYTDSAFLAANGSEFIEVYAGVGAQRVRSLFKRARKVGLQTGKNRAVVFIDEIDVLGGKRGTYQGHQEYDQTLNQLLVEMDGLGRERKGKVPVSILVIAASNRSDLLDPALLRPGRFDRIVRVDLPDKQGRLHVLRLHTRNKPLAPEVDLPSIAQETFGFSGAHLESVANEAAILALRDGATLIGPAHFREAVDKVMLGERLDRKPTPDELRRIAVHETGHALASEVLQPGTVTHLTITSRGNALGYIRNVPPDDFYLLTKEYLERRIQVCLAGSVAEEMVLGSGSTGAVGDFQEAIRLARQYLEAGMSELGVVAAEDLPAAVRYRSLQGIIAGLREKASGLLLDYRDALVNLSECLVRENSLSGDYLREVLKDRAECA